MEEGNGRFEVEVPGQGRVIFVDRNAGIFTHSQCVEVVGATGWFQQDPSIPSCSDTSVYQIDKAEETGEQQFGWDLSMPHKDDLSGNSTQWQMQVSSSPATEDQNVGANLPVQMLNSMVSHNTEAGNVNQEEVFIPVQSSVTQKEEVSPSIGPSSQFVSVIKRTPAKKSRRKYTTETNHLVHESLTLESGVESNGISALEIQNQNSATAKKTPRKRPRISEDENKPTNKKRNTSTKSQTPKVKFEDAAMAFLPEPELNSKPEVVDNVNNSIETPVSSKTPKGSRQDNMVYINIKVMEIPPKEQKNWFADFSCTEPDSGSTSECSMKKKFAKTIKRAREVLCSKIWETVADSILVVEQVFGMRPVIKQGYRRPEGKPIMIRFISQLDPGSAESLATPAPSADIMLSPNDDHGQSLQDKGTDSFVPLVNQLPITIPSYVAMDLSPKKSRELIGPETRIPHDLSTASSKLRSPNECSTQQGPGCSFQGIASDVVIGSSTDSFQSESAVSVDDIVDYNAPPGSRLNPFYFVSKANFKRLLSCGIKTDSHPVPGWIRSKLDSCGYLDVIRDRHHRREELEPLAHGIVSYCYISVVKQKPVSINIVYFRASETRDMKMTIPKFCSDENSEGQKFYMFDDEASLKQETKMIPHPSFVGNSDHIVDAKMSALKVEKAQTGSQKGILGVSGLSQDLKVPETKLFKQAKSGNPRTALKTSENLLDMPTAVGSSDTQQTEHLSSASVSATPVKRKKKTTKIATTIKKETKVKGKKSTEENNEINQLPIKRENPKLLTKKGRPRKLESAVKIPSVSPSAETPDGSSPMDSANKSSKISTPLWDAMRYRKWFPNVAEQTKFYAVGQFLVLADQDDKPEVEVSVYKIIMCEDDRQMLKKFAAVDFNGRVFHHATDTFVPLFGPVKELYSKYRPAVCIKVHKSENGDNVIEVVKYFTTPKMSHLLMYFDTTKDLLTSMRLFTVILGREVVRTGYIGKKVLRASPEYDESIASMWETLDFAINERASTLISEYGYQMDALLPVREHPVIKFEKAGKSETKRGLECTPCKSKGRSRLAQTKVQFLRKAYDRLTFENIEDSPAPPEDFGACYTCRPRLKLLHKVLHHKWLVYAAVYKWVCDLVAELEEDEFLDINEVSHHIFEEYEWQWKSFLEFQSVLAEADREIEILRKGRTQQAIHVKTE